MATIPRNYGMLLSDLAQQHLQQDMQHITATQTAAMEHQRIQMQQWAQQRQPTILVPSALATVAERILGTAARVVEEQYLTNASDWHLLRDPEPDVEADVSIDTEWRNLL